MHFKQIGILLGGGGLLLFAATMQEPEVESQHQTGETVIVASASEDQDGGRSSFAVSAPRGFSAKTEDGGVQLVEEGDLRTPLMVRIYLKPEAGLSEGTEERRTRHGVAQYRVREQEGGSAGPTWHLDAVQRTEKGVLVMEAMLQSELGEPAFTRAWEIFESVDLNQ